METVRAFTDGSGAEPVRGFLHVPAQPVPGMLILTHGAGANCQTTLLLALADAFAQAGVAVLRCDLPFRQEKPHGPPLRTAERDQAGLMAAAEAMRREGAKRIWLGGHSYGGRMASMLAAREPELAEALLLLSYPLHTPSKPEQLRTQHFARIRTPALFVSGMRDGLAAIAELEAARKLIPARTLLVPVASAGHELLGKSNRERLPHLIADEFLSFVDA